MRSISTVVTAAFNAETAVSAWLIQISLTSTYYYTSADVPVEYSGNTYLPRGFEITDIQQNYTFQSDIATIEFDNAAREMSALLLGEDAANKAVICNIAVFDSTAGRVSAVAELMRGYITQWSLNEEKCVISLGSEFMLWSKKTLRLPTPGCPWSFKGTECGYAGDSAKCNKTYKRCGVLGNTDNFGGRRYIADLEGKKIFWGPKGY